MSMPSRIDLGTQGPLAQLVITLNPDKTLSIGGDALTMQDQIRAYGLLELSKDAIRMMFAQRSSGVVSVGADALAALPNGRRGPGT